MAKISVPAPFGDSSFVIDTKLLTCTCLAFKLTKTVCTHLGPYAPPPTPPEPTEVLPTPSTPVELAVSSSTKQKMLDYDAWTRTRLSQNFILRDFLYSARAEVLGQHNRPSDDPEMVVTAGKKMCADILEPMLARFGRFAITYGYQNRTLIEAGYPKSKPHSSSPHQWDRGTFGNRVYARVDILPFCVEDGHVDKYEIGRWMMANLDVDLVMMWHYSNVLCITISPEPRRVYLEWVPQGQGDGNSNRRTYVGEHYWQREWPDLPADERPRFGPSATGGRMYFSK